MSTEHDALVAKAITDIKHHDGKAAAADLLQILQMDTDLSKPENRNAAHVRAQLRRDGEAIHAATGLDTGTLQKLGFPIAEVHTRDNTKK